MVDIRNYVNPQPHGKFTADWQLAFLPDGETYTENKTGEVVNDMIRSVRKGTIIRIRRLFCLGPWNGTPQQRRKEIARRVDAIEEHGGIVLEAELQRRTDVRGQRSQMLMGAYDDIATVGRAVGYNKMGRPGQEFSTEQLDAMRQIWFSRQYRTRNEATAAIQSLGIKTSRTRLYGLFGMPDREPINVTEVISLIPDAQRSGRKKRRPDFVYFIKDGDRVKIGHSVHPTVRMKNLTTHKKLELLGVMPGGREREKQLHAKFAEHLVKGTREWFMLVPEIVKYIAVHRRRHET